MPRIAPPSYHDGLRSQRTRAATSQTTTLREALINRLIMKRGNMRRHKAAVEASVCAI